MGITSIALQYLTVAALRGATLAGDAVQPGAIDALDVDVARMAKPLIAVFIGEDDRKVQGKELIGGEHRVELLIQAFLPAEIDVTVNGAPLRINTREGAADLVMGMLRRQIDRALSASDSDAANLWRILVAEVETASAIPFLFQITEQVRIAANESSYFCRLTVNEPSFGAPLESNFWQAVIAVFAADPDYEPVAAWIAAEISAPDGMATWRVQQADLGLTKEGREGIGLGPLELPTPPDAEAPAIDGAIVDTGDGDAWSIP